MRPDTIAVIVICALAFGYFIHRARKSFRGGASCGCGCDGCGGNAAKPSRNTASCSGCGDQAAPCPPRTPLDHHDDLG
jgi:hypothetical protein